MKKKTVTKSRPEHSAGELIHGPVLVVSGMHEGRVGIYADDTVSGRAVVYLGLPKEPFVMLPKMAIVPMGDR